MNLINILFGLAEFVAVLLERTVTNAWNAANEFTTSVQDIAKATDSHEHFICLICLITRLSVGSALHPIGQSSGLTKAFDDWFFNSTLADGLEVNESELHFGLTQP